MGSEDSGDTTPNMNTVPKKLGWLVGVVAVSTLLVTLTGNLNRIFQTANDVFKPSSRDAAHGDDEVDFSKPVEGDGSCLKFTEKYDSTTGEFRKGSTICDDSGSIKSVVKSLTDKEISFKSANDETHCRIEVFRQCVLPWPPYWDVKFEPYIHFVNQQPRVNFKAELYRGRFK